MAATSSGAAAAYVTERLTNLRVAMALEIATVAGARSGALVDGLISAPALYIVFGVVPVRGRRIQSHDRGHRGRQRRRLFRQG